MDTEPAAMLLGNTQHLHLVPRAVQDLLPQATAAGLSPGSTDGAPSYAWVLHHQALLVWRVEDGPQASVRRLQLPGPIGGRIFVQILSRGGSAPLTVVACTSSGLLAVWLDAQLIGSPYTQQIGVHVPAPSQGGDANGRSEPEVVSAMAACAADSASGAGFIAVIGAAYGSLHLYHGSARGVFPRQFFRPAVPASTSATPDTRSGSRRRSSGLFGAIGGVLQNVYSEAFDPLHKVQRRTASALPALGLALLPLGGAAAASGAGAGGRWRLLVLTQEALDCWLVGAGGGRAAGEEHVWSYNLHGMLSSNLHATELQVLTFATSADGTHVFVWSAAQTASSVNRTLILSQLTLKPDTIPFLENSAPVTGVQLPDPEPQESPRGWQLAAHPHQPRCIARAPNGAAVAWAPAAGSPQPVVAPGVAKAVGCSRVSGLWQVFSVQLGVLEMDGGEQEAGGGEAEDEGMAMQGDMVPEGQHDSSSRITSLLDTTVSLMALEYSAGAPYTELAHGLGQRLARLGAFEGGGCADVLLRHSAGILDQMGKSGASGGAPSGVSLREQLSAKQLRHDLFLAALTIGGVLQRLAPEHLQLLFEHAQQLQAVMSVLATQDAAAAADIDAASQAAAAQGVSVTVSGGAESAVGAVRQAVKAAGDATRTNSDQAVPAWELFFARPSKTAVLLFDAVAQEAAAVRDHLDAADRSGANTGAARQLLGLGLLMDSARAAAVKKQAELLQHFGGAGQMSETPEGGWLSSEGARSAWAHLCEACLAVKPRLLGSIPWRLQLAQSVHMPATVALLAAQVEAAKHMAGPELGQLLGDYRAARAANVASLVEDAVVQLQDLSARGLLASVEAMGRSAFVWQVEGLAVQHHCYPQIAQAAQLLCHYGLTTVTHLHERMRTLPGEEGLTTSPRSLAEYVFEEVQARGKVKELMHFGRCGLAPQLQAYLGAHPKLLWMSQLQGGAFGPAAGTLLRVGQEEKGAAQHRQRLMCLAKLAAVASGHLPRQQTADVELHLLSIQAQLGMQQQPPQNPKQLADQALALAQAGQQGQEALLLGVEALSIATAAQREQYRATWDKVWVVVLEATDMNSLVQLRQAQFQGEAGTQGYDAGVQESLLCRALATCAQALSQAPLPQAVAGARAVLEEVESGLLQRVEGNSERTAVVQDAALLASQQVAAVTTAAA